MPKFTLSNNHLVLWGGRETGFTVVLWANRQFKHGFTVLRKMFSPVKPETRWFHGCVYPLEGTHRETALRGVRMLFRDCMFVGGTRMRFMRINLGSLVNCLGK
jgi:hypothetical protein